ncbi:DUF1611 domain-containing protein [Paenibacillus sp. TH7-28]
MKKVALYPFNKITQGLIRFRDLLDFQIVSVIDFVFHSGEDAGRVVEGQTCGIPIHRSMEEGLEQADTLIVNDPGTSFGGNKDVLEEHNLASRWRELVRSAAAKGIKVVSVHEIYDADTIDWLHDQRISIEVGNGFSRQLLNELDRKFDTSGTRIDNYLKQFKNEALMFAVPKRIKRVGVFATRGCIGKFTTQMNLYREFRNSGIAAAALITEPTGFLFGQPEGDIFKFLAHQSLEKYPYYIDAVTHQAERDGMEWIVMAGQSSILPTMNLVFNSVRFAMLKVFDPQYNLLIVGYEDDAQIEAAIQLLSIYSTRPAALLLPDKMETSYGRYEVFDREIRERRRDSLMSKFAIRTEFIEDAARIKEWLLESDQSAGQREHTGIRNF